MPSKRTSASRFGRHSTAASAHHPASSSFCPTSTVIKRRRGRPPKPFDITDARAELQDHDMICAEKLTLDVLQHLEAAKGQQTYTVLKYRSPLDRATRTGVMIEKYLQTSILILVYRAAVCSDPNTLENLGKAPMLEAKETRLFVQRKDQQQKPGKIETLDVDDYASLFGSLPKLPSDANPTRCKLIESRLLTESQVKTAACIGADEALQAARLVLSHALPSPSAQSSAARPLYLIQVYQIAAETGAVMDRSRANSQVVRLEIQCEGNPDLDSQPASNRCMASQSVMPRAGGQSWTVYLGLTPLTQQAARKRKDRLQQRINKFELSGLHHPSGDPSNFQTLPLQTPPAYPHASPMCIDCYSMDGDRQVEPLEACDADLLWSQTFGQRHSQRFSPGCCHMEGDCQPSIAWDVSFAASDVDPLSAAPSAQLRFTSDSASEFDSPPPTQHTQMFAESEEALTFKESHECSSPSSILLQHREASDTDSVSPSCEEERSELDRAPSFTDLG